MKYLVLFICCSFFVSAQADDTLLVTSKKDIRYLQYLDSLYAYETSYSVAKNVADSLARMIGSHDYDPYFLNSFTSNMDTFNNGYFYEYRKTVRVDVGHISDDFRGMTTTTLDFPWEYLASQYKRLDSIKVQPCGIMTGGELPNVYIYTKPHPVKTVAVVKRFTVVGQIIKFAISDDGKTKTPYIEKIYYIEDADKHQQIDSIEKLDPIYHKHLDF